MSKFNQHPLLATLLNAILVGFSLIASCPAQAQSEQSASARSLEGAWWVTVTLYDCNTGVKRPPFTSMLLFSRGGSVTETTQNPAFAPGQRSVGIGTWKHSDSETFSATDTAFIQFTAGPFQMGTQRLVHSISLNNDGNEWTDEASVQFFNVSGSLIMQGCATASATRLR